jgi:DNA polymerase-1
MLLQIHDELVFEVPPRERDAVVALVHEEMTQALADRLRVPLKVDMSIGDNWLNTSEITPPES